MSSENSIQTVREELEIAIEKPKCQKCGCMDSALKNLGSVLPTIVSEDLTALVRTVSDSINKMHPIQYACLGCEYCHPAIAQNAFDIAFPDISQTMGELSCEYREQEGVWPPVAGEYYVLDQEAPVAVSTLASIKLVDELVNHRSKGLAIVGKTETENIGIDKVIKNVIASPTLRYLIVAGKEPNGHFTGKTLLALAENGVDENGRVIGSPGKRPILRNVSAIEIQTFREQIQIVDMIGCENLDEVSARVEELSQQVTSTCGCNQCDSGSMISTLTTPKITAMESGNRINLDKAGYFVILPLADMGVINVEHYDYDNSLLRVIEGSTARALYLLILNNGWVTELSHAAYLGKELAKAELSLQHNFKYVQDGA